MKSTFCTAHPCKQAPGSHKAASTQGADVGRLRIMWYLGRCWVVYTFREESLAREPKEAVLCQSCPLLPPSRRSLSNWVTTDLAKAPPPLGLMEV